MINITAIDKDSKIPLHKQITNYLISRIQSGELPINYKLPPEREFAEKLGVSRGTVKKAYEYLVSKGYAVVERGIGTFVYIPSENVFQKNHTPNSKINSVIDHLSSQNFTLEEIKMLSKICIDKNINQGKKYVYIAVVDCNPETLEIIKRQLTKIDNLDYTEFLISDVEKYNRAEDVFNEFDVIFTTTTHYNWLNNYIKAQESKIIEAVVSVDKDTIVNISNILSFDQTGVISQSKRFASIIEKNIFSMKREIASENILILNDIPKQEINERIKEFIQTKKTIILPPLYAINITEFLNHELIEFTKGGGEQITFNYAVEKGSLIYIDEKVTQKI